MPPTFRTIIDESRQAARALVDYAGGLVDPTVRLGVTGLTRAGKTVFMTALVHNLIHGGRLPVFEALSSGRIARALRWPTMGCLDFLEILEQVDRLSGKLDFDHRV